MDVHPLRKVAAIAALVELETAGEYRSHVVAAQKWISAGLRDVGNGVTRLERNELHAAAIHVENL